jgi:hypothetical protein
VDILIIVVVYDSFSLKITLFQVLLILYGFGVQEIIIFVFLVLNLNMFSLFNPINVKAEVKIGLVFTVDCCVAFDEL